MNSKFVGGLLKAATKGILFGTGRALLLIAISPIIPFALRGAKKALCRMPLA
jgi:hypothetical protein